MITRNPLNKTAAYLTLFVTIISINTGCDRIRDLKENKAYLTPIPRATIDAYPYNRPVKTKLQAVIAAQQESFHMDWTSPPTAIFTQEMKYEDALQKIEQPGTYSYVEPERLQVKVWLVVFEGDWTITDPLGTTIGPISGCTCVVVDAGDGSVVDTVSGHNLCDTLDLDQ